MKNKKNKKIAIGIIIVIVVVFSFYLAFAQGKGFWPFKIKYQIVNLTNGQVYYGRLSFFPSPKITETWFFQQTVSEKEKETPDINLVPFASSFFGPENVLYLEKEQIAWWADLKEDSAVVKFIKSQKETSEVIPPSEEQLPQQPQK